MSSEALEQRGRENVCRWVRRDKMIGVGRVEGYLTESEIADLVKEALARLI